MVWRANEEMYGPGGGEWVDELGNVTPDPYGTLAPGAQEVPDPMTGAPAVPTAKPFVPVPVIDPSKRPDVQPVAGSEQYSGNSFRPAGSLPGLGGASPTPAAGAPPPDLRPGQANEAGVGGPPDLRPGAANQPAMIPVTQTDTTRTTGETTQGLSAQSRANVEGATQAANAAATRVGEVEAGNINAQADLQRQQAAQAASRGVQDYFQQWGALQVQEEISRETDARLQAAAKFKPDRTALFRGDTGLLFGISAAIAAMAGGWLMGQGLTGGRNPYLDTILGMIDDDANDQIAQNSANMEQLTRILGDSKAAGKELKARMLQSVNDTLQAQAKFQDADQVQRGAAVVGARVEAERAKNQMDAAKMTAETVTRQKQTTSQSSTKMVANPAAFGGLDVNDAKTIATMQKVGALDDLVREAVSLKNSGELAANTGLLDEAAGSVARAFHARSPGQKKVEDFKAALQLINRADWASEPNGQDIQRQLSSIGVPENDAEIPQAVERLRTILNQADPGGRFRSARRALGDRPAASETGTRVPIVR